MDAACSTAVAALSNFLKDFNLNLYEGLARVFICSKNFCDQLRRCLQGMMASLKLHTKLHTNLHIHVGDTLSSGGILRKTMLEELFVLGLQQGIARAGLRENEERHGEGPQQTD